MSGTNIAAAMWCSSIGPPRFITTLFILTFAPHCGVREADIVKYNLIYLGFTKVLSWDNYWKGIIFITVLDLMGLPNFYQTCLNQSASILAKDKVHNHDEILHENNFWKWFNADKETLFLSHQARSGLVKIRAIWKNVSNTWKSGKFIFNRLNNKCNLIAEYGKIKAAIPKRIEHVYSLASKLQK